MSNQGKRELQKVQDKISFKTTQQWNTHKVLNSFVWALIQNYLANKYFLSIDVAYVVSMSKKVGK